MNRPMGGIWGALLMLSMPLPSLAGWGNIDSFGASAVQVQEGTWVDFTVSWSASGSSSSWGGSDLNEPAPSDGYQYWALNWYGGEQESITAVWLSAGGQGSHEFVSGSPGSQVSGAWTFSMQFPAAGWYSVDVSGGWESRVESFYHGESASRSCMYTDPGNSNDLWCDSWQYQYQDDFYDYTNSGSFTSPSPLSIEVLAMPAAVPEPASAALFGAGLLGLLALRRRGPGLPR